MAGWGVGREVSVCIPFVSCVINVFKLRTKLLLLLDVCVTCDSVAHTFIFVSYKCLNFIPAPTRNNPGCIILAPGNSVGASMEMGNWCVSLNICRITFRSRQTPKREVGGGIILRSLKKHSYWLVIFI